MNLDQAVVYDIETMPNVFTLHAEMLNTTACCTWEISHFKDDRQALITWFTHLQRTQTPMLGFNNERFDYAVCHAIMKNPQISVEEIYQIAMQIINSKDRFSGTIWQRDRFAPQIDLMKIQHMDNVAKMTSLKALQIAMRSPNVVDPLGTEIPFGTPLTRQQIDQILIPYNIHDVEETKRFAHYTMDAINFRASLVGKIDGDVMNFNDTKIGAKVLEQRLGDEICYDRSSGKKIKRQTPRGYISLNEIIFPYIQFENPEFNRVLEWMKQQTLTSKDIDIENAKIETKGVFKGVEAVVGGMKFKFGTGGIHGSVEAQKIQSTKEWLIEDIDVASLYPEIAVQNGLAPEHLGSIFSKEYHGLLIERRKHKKGTVENASMKLAANGTYGNSNSPFSVFYDPKFTMTITINGQLLLCMLAERLLHVPTLQFIQINTDGITYRVHKNFKPLARIIQQKWEKLTCLVLESANYKRMWIRDVNNYIAEDDSGKLKQKGAYWHPDPNNYADSISKAGPPAWHKDFNPTIVTRTAVAVMTTGVKAEHFMRANFDPYDFMLRAKVQKSVQLMHGNKEIQGTSRFFVSKVGQPLKKISPPAKGNRIGDYKRKSKLTDQYFESVKASIPVGSWDERIHTKNKSKYQIVETAMIAGKLTTICNDVNDFHFNNVDFEWYLKEVSKLVIS